MRGKTLAITLLVLVAIAVVIVLVRLKTVRRFGQAVTYHVTIIMNNDGSCKQVDTDTNKEDDFPTLHRDAGDSIVWDDGKDKHGESQRLEVTFPLEHNGHVGTPFRGGGNPNFIFHNHDNSGNPGPESSGVRYDKYPYQKVTIGGNECSNPGDPGVIIDK